MRVSPDADDPRGEQSVTTWFDPPPLWSEDQTMTAIKILGAILAIACLVSVIVVVGYFRRARQDAPNMTDYDDID